MWNISAQLRMGKELAFLKKLKVFLKLTLFISITKDLHKNVNIFWKFSKNEAQIMLPILCNFASYVTSYLQRKTFAWKRKCTIISKSQILWYWPRPFKKSLIKFYKVYQEELKQLDNFQTLLNFRLPLTFKLIYNLPYFDQSREFAYFYKVHANI